MTRIEYFRQRLQSQPGPVASAALCVAAVAIPTAIRSSIDSVVSDTTFTAYYPFVLLSALLMTWRYAALVAVVSAIVANYLFMSPRFVLFAQATDTIGALLFAVSSAMIIIVAQSLRRTVAELRALGARERHLNVELQHRVKNTLAVVQGLATQTFRHNEACKDPMAKLQGRIRALARANQILSSGRWETCGLPDLLFSALDPFNDSAAINFTGEPCALPEESCVPLVLALHELATNAVKYGALSTPDGWIDLTWSVPGDGDRELVLCWTERGGPLVRESTHKGLGSRLLRAQAGLKSVVTTFRPEGLECRIVVAGAQPIPVATD